MYTQLTLPKKRAMFPYLTNRESKMSASKQTNITYYVLSILHERHNTVEDFPFSSMEKRIFSHSKKKIKN